jgi:hypothetical protein
LIQTKIAMENNLMNLNEFKENLADKVRTEFANLIPQEALDSFIAETVKKFEKEELQKLVMETLKEHAKEAIKEMLQTNSYGMWNSETNLYEMKPEIERILIAAAPKMFGAIMNDVARMTLSNMQNSVY